MEMTLPTVVQGALHTAFPIDDASRVGEARRHAARLAVAAELDETEAGRVAIIVTELGTNLLRHAWEGQLLLASRPDHGEVEILAIDRGPGMADIAASMRDGFSTGGTSGTGLGAVRRLAQDFDLHSAVPDGTVVVARVRRAGLVGARQMARYAGISLAAPGETACGDAWAISLDEDRATLMVVDGLGHGPEAAKAAQAAIAAFSERPQAGPGELVELSHAALRGTRGAALSVLRLDARDNTVRVCGAGNILARIVSGISERSLLTQHGTAGLQIRRPEEITTPWPPHALLVAHSDGIEARWVLQRLLPVLGRDPSLAAAILLRDHCRGRDDATVVVVRRAG